MATNGTTTQRSRPTDRSRPTAATRADAEKIREGFTKVRNGGASYARHTAERSVDVPVGVALTFADRVNELVEPFTRPVTANRELRSLRTRVQRELNRFERRGASARRKARTRARRTRNQVQRDLRQGRRRARTTLKRNRAKAEDGFKRAQTTVQERVSALV